MKAAGALNGRCKYKIVPDQLQRMAGILDIDVKMQDSPRLALWKKMTVHKDNEATHSNTDSHTNYKSKINLFNQLAFTDVFKMV